VILAGSPVSPFLVHSSQLNATSGYGSSSPHARPAPASGCDQLLDDPLSLELDLVSLLELELLELHGDSSLEELDGDDSLTLDSLDLVSLLLLDLVVLVQLLELDDCVSLEELD
jgi:hypothetical protein